MPTGRVTTVTTTASSELTPSPIIPRVQPPSRGLSRREKRSTRFLSVEADAATEDALRWLRTSANKRVPESKHARRISKLLHDLDETLWNLRSGVDDALRKSSPRARVGRTILNI